MRYQIFISYRRDGGESLAALLHERFVRMGYRVFYDVESLRSGNFNEKLLEVISECDDVLVVLPPGGLDRCIADESDWVRREIVHALKCEKNVIPILMRNFSFPENLPDDLKPLVNKNGVSATMEYFDAVVDKLAKQRLTCKPDQEADRQERHIQHLEELAQQGDAAAANEMGIVCEYGSATRVPNLKKAMEYYTKAEKENLAARYNLGDIYERCSIDLTLIHEYGILPDMELMEEKNTVVLKESLKKKALEYYQCAADEKYAPALYKMGSIYEAGANDVERAFTYYRQSATQKYLPALNALGWMYRNGIGTSQDLEKAEDCYKEAAEAGYPAAIYNYAHMLETRDPEKAMNLYKQVAYGENALPCAVYALGRQYEFVLRDMRNAISCYEKAAKSGMEEARDDLERCRNTLA